MTESPTEVVRATINEVIRILEDKRLQAADQRAHRRRLLEDAIGRRFDYTEMAKRVLAAAWNTLNEAERAEFVGLFRSFLSDRYASKIEGYSGEQVAYLAERREGSFAEVRTKLISSKVEVPVDYRLMAKDGKWYAYDIVVDGVSLVRNYRSQFANIIRTSSYQELVRKLRERDIREERNPAG
ncbi:MAG: ABC transporter substrate-binding protein [Nitrospirota bacterium]